jgi:acetyl-CoA carboxylase alpha subunit
MGEMDNNGLQFFCNGKPIRQGDFGCGHITNPSPSHAERMASLKAEVDAMAEKYQPIVDELMREIYKSSQKPIELLSEETAQQINKAFENLRMTMENGFPMTFTKRKYRKHYKPKFTL